MIWRWRRFSAVSTKFAFNESNGVTGATRGPDQQLDNKQASLASIMQTRRK
jgi:hypothetical protein